jgi:hypothetical protein
MMEFQIASEQAVKDEEQPDGELEVFEFSLGKHKFAARRPTPGEINVLFSTRGDVEGTVGTWRFLRKVLQGTGYRRLVSLVESGAVPVPLLFGGDELNPGGGIVDTIIAEFAGRPPGSSGDSSESPKDAGPRSTGRAPGRGSTSSDSD